jgi:cleavage and polyadenylation specificity factor subunit 3
MGTLAIDPPKHDRKLSGLLVKRNFNYHLLAPTDLNKYTDLVMSTISQKLTVHFSDSFEQLKSLLGEFELKQVDAKQPDEHKLLLFRQIQLTYLAKQGYVTLEWISSPLTDMYTDAIIAVLQK